MGLLAGHPYQVLPIGLAFRKVAHLTLKGMVRLLVRTRGSWPRTLLLHQELPFAQK
jgi:hypothetical protein